MNNIYVVVGMHKSGTTLISQMLHFSGIDMGIDDVTKNYDDGNHYERKSIQLLNKLMINDRYKPSYIARKKNVIINDKLFCMMVNTVNKLNNEHSHWGFKDPRTCLTYSEWRKVLGPHKIIFIYREPYEVWLRYCKNNNILNWIKSIVVGIYVLITWYEYNNEIFSSIRYTKNRFIIKYDKFIESDDEYKELCRFINKDIIDIRDKKKYRNKKINKESMIYNIQKKILKYILKYDIDKLLNLIIRYE